jgi:hypothetical protein
MMYLGSESEPDLLGIIVQDHGADPTVDAVRMKRSLLDMEAYRTETVIQSDRVLILHDVPFRSGEKVKVIVLSPLATAMQ